MYEVDGYDANPNMAPDAVDFNGLNFHAVDYTSQEAADLHNVDDSHLTVEERIQKKRQVLKMSM